MYLLPTVNGFYFQQPKNLGRPIYVKKVNAPVFTLWVLNLFTNWVITHFGSNFLDISQIGRQN